MFRKYPLMAPEGATPSAPEATPAAPEPTGTTNDKVVSTPQTIQVNLGGRTVELTPLEAQQLLDLGYQKFTELTQGPKGKEEAKEVTPEDQIKQLQAQVNSLAGMVQANRNQDLINRHLETLVGKHDFTKGDEAIAGKVKTLVLTRLVAQPNLKIDDVFAQEVKDLEGIQTKARAGYIRQKIADAKETQIENSGQAGTDPPKKLTFGKSMREHVASNLRATGKYK